MRVLFIPGMARSGTSWLGKIFNAHPEVLYHFEPFDRKPEREDIPKDLKFWGLIDKIEKVDPERRDVRRAARWGSPFSKPIGTRGANRWCCAAGRDGARTTPVVSCVSGASIAATWRKKSRSTGWFRRLNRRHDRPAALGGGRWCRSRT